MTKKILKRTTWIIGTLVVIVLFSMIQNGAIHLPKVLGSEYQAVFLTNGQVFFGQMSGWGSSIVLRDVYYLQVSDSLNTNPENLSNEAKEQKVQLVKLGSELHGPQDAMHIPKDKILYWEDMKNDSKVVVSIREYQEGQK